MVHDGFKTCQHCELGGYHLGQFLPLDVELLSNQYQNDSKRTADMMLGWSMMTWAISLLWLHPKSCAVVLFVSCFSNCAVPVVVVVVAISEFPWRPSFSCLAAQTTSQSPPSAISIAPGWCLGFDDEVIHHHKGPKATYVYICEYM